MVNAVTPESSPIPTPKHKKAEYKIEVFIPPNISDPLSLMQDGNDDDYDASFNKKKTRPRKRNHNRKTDPESPKEVKKVRFDSSQQEKEKNEDVPDVTEQEVNESKEQQIKKGDSKPKYQYGNYNRYYGYRLEGSDPRMGYFNPDWFRNKDILDIGCNVGEVSCMINVHCLSSVKVLKCLKFTFSFAGDHGNC